MSLFSSNKVRGIIISFSLMSCFLGAVPKASLDTTNIANNDQIFLPLYDTVEPLAQNLLIKQRNPTVNEENRITLTAVDSNGRLADGVIWSSGSPDIAQVNPTTGEVKGVKQGFATITAKRGSESVSTFVVVARVRKGKGERVPGDSKLDSTGRLYISNPLQNVILVADKALTSGTKIFAGQRNRVGSQNGFREQALFAGPTAIAIDNNSKGGIYVADTLNHGIRKIGFNQQVETLIGAGFPGKSQFDSNDLASFGQTLFNSPRGLVSDVGGNLYVSDTDNHAIYYVDFVNNTVNLLAGQPGESGKEDGVGKQARFKRPAGLALSADGRLLTVADEDNNRVRVIEITRQANGRPIANVSTLGTSSGANIQNHNLVSEQNNNEIVFDRPQSVSLDGVNNIYVVDNTGVQVVTSPFGQNTQVTQLAQPGVSFNQAVNVVVQGTETFVLDAAATSEDEAIKVVTVGAPEITNVNPGLFRMEGGAEIVVTGSNFAPESVVTFGGNVIKDAQIVSATEIRFRVPSQDAPGIRTFSVLTRGGIAQKEVNVIAKPVSELGLEEITTIAGGTAFSGDGGKALEANLSILTNSYVDSLGNVFIADNRAERIRRVDKETGIINTIAGGGTSLEDGVVATTARIQPTAIVLDSAGNIFIADALTQSVRRIDAITNIITTIAGGKSRSFSGDGGQAINAGFGETPRGLIFDAAGNLFVSGDNRVRKIDNTTKIITTVVGSGNFVFSGDGGPALSAGLRFPRGLAFDSKGNLFIADTANGRVRRVDGQTNIITTIAGNGDFFGGSDRDGKPATSIGLVGPGVVVVDSNDNVIVSDGIISRINVSTGIINVIKQNPDASFKCGDEDIQDFLFPSVNTSMNIDGNGNLYASDSRRIRSLNINTGVVRDIAGKRFLDQRGDGDLAIKASLGSTIDTVTDPKGNIFLADFDNGVIRRIDAATGIISRFAGVGKPECITFDDGGRPNGDGGPALNATFFQPIALATDSQGNLFVADTSDGKVRRIDAATNIITTFAGDGSLEDNISGDGGQATKAGLGGVVDIATDSQGNLLIASRANVRRVDARTGIITTIAGNGKELGEGRSGKDGDPATQVAISPVSISVDRNGNVFIADRQIGTNKFLVGSVVRRVDAITGAISTVAGNTQSMFSGEGGLATSAGIGFVRSVDVDKAGNLFISAGEFDSNRPETFGEVVESTRIFRVNATSGNIATLIKGNNVYKGDGGSVANASVFSLPNLHLSNTGNLLFNELQEPVSSIRLIRLPEVVTNPVGNIVINNAAYQKPRLVIDGQGFGTTAKVFMNGVEISRFLSNQTDSQILMTGNRKKLNMRKGVNQVTVTNSSGASANFQFTFSIAQ